MLEIVKTRYGNYDLYRSQIKDYLDKYFDYALDVWDTTRHCGAPLPGGWNDWPGHVVDIITVFNAEYELIKREADNEKYITLLEFTAGRKLR